MVKLKKLLLSFLFLSILPIAAHATVITVQSQAIPNWYGPSTTELRLFLDRGFITSDNKVLQAGNQAGGLVYQKVACSLSGTTLTVASFSIDSTTDGQDYHSARYSAYFYNTATNQRLQPYNGFEAFQVPPVFITGTTTTWTGIRLYNAGAVPVPMDLQTYSRTEIDLKISQVNGLINPMNALGDIIIGNTGGSPMRLAGNTTTTKKFLESTGTGSAANLPSYQALTSGDITTALGFTPANQAGDTFSGAVIMGSTLTLHADPTLSLQAATKQYVDSKVGGIASLNGSSFATPTFANDTNVGISTNIGTGVNTFTWSGTLAPARGGLGLASYSTGDIPYANGSASITTLNIGSPNRVLTVNGGGNAPVWSLLSLTASVTGILPGANGGTGSANVTITGPTAPRTFTIADATATILTTANAVTPVQGGTGIASYTTGDLPYANSSTTLAKLALGGANTVLHGGSTAPAYSAVDLSADTTGTTPATKGGTGLTSYVFGDILYSSAANTLSALAGNITTTRKFLRQAGNGANSAAPAWDTLIASDLTTALTTPPPIGGVTPNTGAFTTLSASSTLTTALTQNSIPFIGTSGLLTQNNSRLTWDNSGFVLGLKGSLGLLGSTSGTVTLKAPATGGTATYTLPAAPPSFANYVLASDTSGNMSWIPGGGGGGGAITINSDSGPAFLLVADSTHSDFAINTTNDSMGTATVTFSLPDAGASARGVVTTGTQTFAGNKTFSGATAFNGNISMGTATKLALAAGTTSVPAIQFTSGVQLTSAVAGATEWDGSNLFITQTSGPTRQRIAYTDATNTASVTNAVNFTGNLAGDISGPMGTTSLNITVPLNKGGTGQPLSIGSTGQVMEVVGGVVAFSSDASHLTGLDASQLASNLVPAARLTGVIVDASVAGGAAIAWSKISKSGSSIADLATRSASDLNAGTLADTLHSSNIQLVNSSVVAFTGAGLNDLTAKAPTYNQANINTYTVIVDATGTPDSFKWQKNGGSFTTGVAITGSAQTLTDGVQVTFAATTGHTLGNQWVVTQYPQAGKDVENGIAGLSSTKKLALSEGQEVWSVTDLTSYATTSGSGTQAILSTITSPSTNQYLGWSGTDWVNMTIPAAGAHNLLGSSVHTDTNTNSPSVGALIMGTDAVSSKWDKLAVGSVGNFLQVVAGSNGNVANWASTLQLQNGGLGLGSGTSGGIPYFSNSTTSLTSSGMLTAKGIVLGGGTNASPTTTNAGTTNGQVPQVVGGTPTFQAFDLAASGAVQNKLPLANIAVNDAAVVAYRDEFGGGLPTGGTSGIGQLGWRTPNSSGTATLPIADGTHIGLAKLATLAAINNSQVLCLGTPGTTKLFGDMSSYAWSATFVFKTDPTAVAGVGYYIGFFDQTTFATISASTHGIGLRYDNQFGGYADATFKYVTYNGTSITTVSSGVTPAANTWYKLTISSDGLGGSATITYNLTGGSQQTINSNVPSSGLDPIWNVTSRGTGATHSTYAIEAITADLFAFSMTGNTR